MTSKFIEAFDTLKASGLSQPETWKPIYREGLREAFQRNRLDDAAELAVFAAVCLESQGYYEDAIAELEFAVARTRAAPGVTVMLLVTLAAFQAIRGDLVALDTLGAVSALTPLVSESPRPFEIETHQALVECVFLRPQALETAREASERAQSAGLPRYARGLDIWAVPAMVAFGQRRRAVPWVNSLAAHAEAERSTFRQADAAALEFGLQSVERFDDLDLAPFERARRNNMAAWRAHVTVLHNALRRGDAEAAAETARYLEDLSQRLNPGHGDGLAALREAARVGAEDVREDLEPPAELTLVNLPSVLAAMEVIATRGVQEQAVQWARWAAEHIPAHVQTSIEWPASRERVQALLLVRIGNERVGTAMMERGARWAKSAGYPIETALCEVQLSELLALGPGAAPERRWASMRRGARAVLRAAGVEPGPYSLATTEALAWGRAAEAEPKLSPREVEVLGLLAEGLTYKQVGERLGIEWRTVQVHARRVYEKLGVSGKMRAARPRHGTGHHLAH